MSQPPPPVRREEVHIRPSAATDRSAAAGPAHHVDGGHVIHAHDEMRYAGHAKPIQCWPRIEPEWQRRRTSVTGRRSTSGSPASNRARDAGVRLERNSVVETMPSSVASRAEQSEALPHRSAREPSLLRYVIRIVGGRGRLEKYDAVRTDPVARAQSARTMAVRQAPGGSRLASTMTKSLPDPLILKKARPG